MKKIFNKRFQYYKVNVQDIGKGEVFPIVLLMIMWQTTVVEDASVALLAILYTIRILRAKF